MGRGRGNFSMSTKSYEQRKEMVPRSSSAKIVRPSGKEVVVVENNLSNPSEMIGGTKNQKETELMLSDNVPESSDKEAGKTSDARQLFDLNGEPENEKQNKKSWAGLFKDNRSPAKGMKLRFIPTEGDCVDMSIGEPLNMIEVWGYCLVGFFTGMFPGFRAVHKLMEDWGVRCKLLPHYKGWLVFQFKTEEDRTKVLLNGPYDVLGRMLMLKELSEDFSFEDEEFLKVPIWIKFPRFPMECWNEEKISLVASKVGLPIYTDGVTNEKTKLDYARGLIEVDVSKPPPVSVRLRLRSRRYFTQYVVYETFPNYCFHCKKFGHHPFTYKVLHNLEREQREEEQRNKELYVQVIPRDDMESEVIKESEEHREEDQRNKEPFAQVLPGNDMESGILKGYEEHKDVEGTKKVVCKPSIEPLDCSVGQCAVTETGEHKYGKEQEKNAELMINLTDKEKLSTRVTERDKSSPKNRNMQQHGQIANQSRNKHDGVTTVNVLKSDGVIKARTALEKTGKEDNVGGGGITRACVK
ncbi:unnamed protein product [Cuscuta epithymum]|uniref:DUF4283 domain-containing protein n=1 Tax=Cuscuta epithymum TaxID=186058 RepID=A0AAV0EPG2_9ASTE|nr:unnamed protein product [Cuscuta epithymum]